MLVVGPARSQSPTVPGLALLLGQIPLDLTLEMNLLLGLVSVRAYIQVGLAMEFPGKQTTR